MKAYCANEKPFVYSIFSESDTSFTMKILENIHGEGVLFWFTQVFTKKEIHHMDAASSVLFFLSNDSLSNSQVLKSIDVAIQLNKKILCIYLEDVTLSPGKEMQLGSMQSLYLQHYKKEEVFFEKLKQAEIFSELEVTPAQKRFARQRGLASIFIPIVTAVVLFITIVVPLLIVPLITAANGSLNDIGFGNLSLSNLAKVKELYVIGNKSYDKRYYTFYYQGSKNEVYINELNTLTPIGNISDITDLSLLKNAQHIAFEANQIIDISPLYQIKTLESLTLNCNPIKSIEGIEALQNLKSISIAGTKIIDISPLFKIPGLERIEFENTYVSSIEGIENLTNLNELRTGSSNLTDLSPLRTIDFSYTKEVGFSFEAKGTLIRDFSPLSGILKFNEIQMDISRINLILPYLEGKEVTNFILAGSDIDSFSQLSSLQNIKALHLPWSGKLTSIDGIENQQNLIEVKLDHCPQLNDLTPLLNLPKLETVYLSQDMKDLVSVQLKEARFNIEYINN